MLGGFVTYYAFAVFGVNYFLTLVLAVLVVGGAGVLAERVVFRHLRGKTLNAFIGSRGLRFVLQTYAEPSVGVLDKAVPPAASGIARVSGLLNPRERFVVSVPACALT